MSTLLGQYISSSYQKLHIRDNVITDGTGSIIYQVNVNSITASVLSSENYNATGLNLEFQSTRSFEVTNSGSILLYDETLSPQAPDGSLLVSGSVLYFGVGEQTGDLKPYVLTPTTNSVYITPVSTSISLQLNTLNTTRTFEITAQPTLHSSQSLNVNVHYVVRLKDLRTGSLNTGTGSISASLQVNTTSGNLDVGVSSSIYPYTDFESSLISGSFEVLLTSGSYPSVSCMLTGSRLNATVESEIELYVESASIVLSTPECLLNLEDITASYSASYSLQNYQRVTVEAQPYYMTPFITGSNTPVTYLSPSSLNLSLSRYYYNFGSNVVIFKGFVGSQKKLTYIRQVPSVYLDTNLITPLAVFEENKDPHVEGINLEIIL
jgi:hypothetical protein